jgi:segregation and condensation protein B
VKQIIEVLLFATDEPLSLKQMSEILALLNPRELHPKVGADEMLQMVEELNREYEQTGRGFRIVKVAGGYQFATRPEFGVWLGAMVRERSRRKLSVSALETLAVIAYKQPVTKPEIEAIRGVNVDYVLHTLLERNLAAIIGRAATPGRPLLYGTTRDFLKRFGLNDLAELPKPREIEELMAEAEFEVEKQMLKDLEAKRVAEEGDIDGEDRPGLEEREERERSGGAAPRVDDEPDL